MALKFDTTTDPKMAQTKLTIGILETGRPPEELKQVYGDYPGMVASWLGDLDANFVSYPVLDNELPPSPTEADLWVITGSKFGAYEDHPWIPPLEDFIRACKQENVMMFGICFGHQMIAQALGGVVRKSTKGWGLGVHEYDFKNWPAELGQQPENLAIQAYHQDQVEEIPDGAEILASSPFCEAAALWYPGFAITVQGHPEFAKPYASALLESRRGTVLSDKDVDQGQENMAIADNRASIATLVGQILRNKQSQMA
ncbi:type 1 glutamine amidotransferase [Phaeobacter sp. NW0010-22]